MSLISQSTGLSNRHKQLARDGRHITDDSKISEKKMVELIPNIIDLIITEFKKTELKDVSVIHKKQITLAQCKKCMGYSDSICDKDKRVYMKPDGGIYIAVVNNKQYIMMILEDKVQGTNDLLFSKGKKRQSTGNAIERGAKNINGCKMLCINQSFFPYALFAAGCDFHPDETISKRIEMFNYGEPIHHYVVSKTTTPIDREMSMKKIISNVNVKKRFGGRIEVASTFIKTHKWNDLPHGSSLWTKNEIFDICSEMIKQSVQQVVKTEITNHDPVAAASGAGY